MKTAYAALAVTAMTTSLVATADAGIIHYSFEADTPTASIGDTVNVTVRAEIDPQTSPFAGLASALFDIQVADPSVAGGVIDNTPPALGLKSDFLMGDQGTLAGPVIAGVHAFQMSPNFGPPINTGTDLDLYSFTYTITDADPRTILLNLTVYQSQVWTSDIPPLSYDSSVTPLSLHVVQTPAPGALALLGAAGLLGLRRRRTH